MSRSLLLAFHSASAKYSRLSKKINKSISRGEFWRFTRRKRNHLLARVEKLRRRLADLKLQIRLATAGITAAALFAATPANAQQTAVGPFVRNDEKNPLPPPAFELYRYPTAYFQDLDADGDLDAVITETRGAIHYFENTGDNDHPIYQAPTEFDPFGSINLPGPYDISFMNPPHMTFADIDNDGDLDAIVTVFQASYGASSDPDPIIMLINQGDAQNPDFVDINDSSPLWSESILKSGWPAFVDVDGDGDQDLLVSGFKYDKDLGGTWMQYYRNDQETTTPGIIPQFTKVTGDDNPFKFTGGINDYQYIGINFADLDEDGDPDWIYNTDDGKFHYRRNDNGTFVEQTGPWTFNTNNHGASTGNPLDLAALDGLSTWDQYKSITFSDVDADGDLDAVLGINALELDPSATSFFFLENTGHSTFAPNNKKGLFLSGTDLGYYATSTFYDFDKDGDLDIVALSTSFTATNCEGSQCEHDDIIIRTVFYNENGAYVKHDDSVQQLPDDLEITDDSVVKLVDVNGDGDLDLLVSDNESSKYTNMYYYEAVDNGYEAPPSNPFAFISENEYNGAFADLADLNNDGLPDLVITRFDGRIPEAYKNIGTKDQPEFQFEETWSSGLNAANFGWAMPSLVDMDNDADFDLVVAKYGEIWYYENQGGFENPDFHIYFQGDTNTRNPFDNFSFSGLASFNFADIDGDGDRDLLYLDLYYATFGYYENTNPSPKIDFESSTELVLTANTLIPLIDQFNSLTDADGDPITKVVITVEPYRKGLDKLVLDALIDGVSADWDDDKGILTLHGFGASYGTFGQALQAVKFIAGVDAADAGNGGLQGARKAKRDDNAKLVQKVVTMTIYDSDNTITPDNQKVFTITGDDATPNTPPTITGSATPFYISGELVVNPDIDVTDTDDIIASGKVSISGGLHSGEDQLLFDDQGKIKGSYDANAGVLTLTGFSTPEEYTTALRSVRYLNSLSEPTTDDRVVTFSVYDGSPDVTATTTIVINKPPVIDIPEKHAATGGNIALTISQVITDPDNNLDLSTLQATPGNSGAAVDISNGLLTVNYSSVPTYQGDDAVTVKVCDTAGRCTTQDFAVLVRADAVIFTGMSPNGDGINDWFSIDFLPEGTQVAIYNRWGDSIFETSNYDPEDPAARFEGKNKNGTDVVAGSYFYKVKYPDGRTKNGYILLNR